MSTASKIAIGSAIGIGIVGIWLLCFAMAVSKELDEVDYYTFRQYERNRSQSYS